MFVLEKIDNYDIDYYAAGKNAGGYPYQAIIALRRADNSLIAGAYFHRDPATMPDADDQADSGYVSCHYAWADFPRVVDMLRNESPVFLRYTEGTGAISAINEPAGEGEPRAPGSP